MWDYEKQGDRRRSPLKSKFDLTTHENPPQYLGDDLFQEKYTLKVTVYTEFWSNNAQIDAKLDLAKKMANSYLYKDIIPLVNQIMLESDSEEVYYLAGKIKELTNPT